MTGEVASGSTNTPGSNKANDAGALGLAGADELADSTAKATDDDSAAQAIMADEEAEAEPPPNYWLWLLVVGLLLLILLGIVYRRRLHDNSRARRGNRRRLTAAPATPFDHYERLEGACRANAAQQAYDALLDWVRADLRLTPPTLAQLRTVVPMSFRQQLDELSMVLYSRQADEWQGVALWGEVQRFCAEQRDTNRQASQGDLLNLYP